jgi:hypothetical protein
VELLETRVGTSGVAPSPVAGGTRNETPPEQPAPAAASAPTIALTQLQDAWQRSVLPAVQERSIPVATLLGEAHPSVLEGDIVTLEFAPAADFHRRTVEEPKNLALVQEALYEVTGRRLAVATVLAESDDRSEADDEEPLGEDAVISLLKDTLDAREIEES